MARNCRNCHKSTTVGRTIQQMGRAHGYPSSCNFLQCGHRILGCQSVQALSLSTTYWLEHQTESTTDESKDKNITFFAGSEGLQFNKDGHTEAIKYHPLPQTPGCIWVGPEYGHQWWKVKWKDNPKTHTVYCIGPAEWLAPVTTLQVCFCIESLSGLWKTLKLPTGYCRVQSLPNVTTHSTLNRSLEWTLRLVFTHSMWSPTETESRPSSTTWEDANCCSP